MDTNTKRIIFCGTRGVPANYGGFETAVDEISKRLAARGYVCDVVCRSADGAEESADYDGRHLIFVQGSSQRKLDTFVSSFYSGMYLLKNAHRYQHVFWFNNANLPGILLSLLVARKKTSVNTDGLEWRRGKWSPPFKAYYFISSAIISWLCRNLISDSRAIQDYYKQTFKKSTHFIPYGHPAHVETSPNLEAELLARYGLSPGKYTLQVTRFEPDNLPLEVAKAFAASGQSNQGYKHVVIGFKDPTSYSLALKELDGKHGVQVVPATYDATVLSVLRNNCFAYIHGNSVGGTNPALLEAMTSCPRVLAIEGPFSREVLGDTGAYFTLEDLAYRLTQLDSMQDQRPSLRQRVESLYQWDAVAQSYADLAESGHTTYLPQPLEAGFLGVRGSAT